MSDLMKTIATCFEQVAFFFPSGDPKNQESFQHRANYLDLREYSREILADTLKAYHEDLGANSETFQFIEELRHKETLVVITGQQAGFFTGPLYTLYKAITTIRLAKEQREKLGRPVVPVFWIAGEDHDWQEIRETYFLNSEGKPISCQIPGDGGGESVGYQKVPAWETIEDQFKEIPESEFRSSVLKECRQITERAENLTQWFALTLQYLVSQWGLIFFDPMIPEFKRLAMPMYEQILKMHVAVRKALAVRTEKWVELGFTQQIHPTGGEVNLFLAIPERRAILYDNDYFNLRGQKERWDLDTLNQMLKQRPEQFSPNVVTRPIIQEYLFPTLAYVPGPGELNYWAQLGEVFTVFNFVMPILYPRLSAVVLIPSWRKSLLKQELSIEDVFEGLEEHKSRCVRERDSHDIDEHFERLYRKIREGYAELAPLEDIHGNVRDWLVKNEAKVSFQINYLKGKIWQAQRKRCSEVLRRLQELEDGITPLHSRQERILNPLTFVCQYGSSFVDNIAELPIDKFEEHKVLL
ncbi:bacillithiol biosynthesis cysteine-adding enzyme BshC [Desulfosporosinus orientis DSM 765]|uniref:Putative cysteine ligase BshC n=1 Tax=Desulfosporosinus orientis (strain ATCC 19365 / DSM 765 / NCIMB 8382 / VKM B-1628 / Singapore I) TaxID=768706 RepID=G7WHW0_DESOD|nr:bacillithiol biosynthesis cysteine-adding enzyme BshC [Desulfosporosinus orientis]AET70257.1 bacillithiol biosynthesis cysteine-adding enzyme BshC [Desulfosporosinus orientis DSM 765]